MIKLHMTRSDALVVQDAISDVLCWLRGWEAAAPKRAGRYGPLGTEKLRDLNIALKRAIENEDQTK